MDTQILVLGGSLSAILALAGVAWALRLGHPLGIDDADHAKSLAREADTAFAPVEAAVCEEGGAAIVADAAGRIMVLRRHGAHIAGRVLAPGASARVEQGTLTVIPTDRTYGPVALKLGDHAQSWTARIDGVCRRGNA